MLGSRWMGTITALLAALMILLVAGSGQVVVRAGSRPSPSSPTPLPRPSGPNGAPMPLTTPSVVQASGGLPAPAHLSGAAAAAAPAALQIPSIGVNAALGTVGLDADGTIGVPSDWNQPAWYTGGPAPGQLGPAIIVGHLDSYTAPAVFWNLHQLTPGAAIVVTQPDGSPLTFTVSQVVAFDKSAFPAATVYGNTADPELRLITCGGTYNLAAGAYDQNTVVFATLTPN